MINNSISVDSYGANERQRHKAGSIDMIALIEKVSICDAEGYGNINGLVSLHSASLGNLNTHKLVVPSNANFR